jgi:hypothetical protein
MGTLQEEYSSIFKEGKRWKYYKVLEIEKYPFDFKDVKPEDYNEKAKEFIKLYFEAGNKDWALNGTEESNRQLHSVSTFFLGILLKEAFFPELFNSPGGIDNNRQEPDFLYFWFLTCLYHDMGYAVESNKETYPPNELDFDSLVSKVKEILQIQSSSFNLFDEGECSSIYPIATIKCYYEYCRNSSDINTINHGIVGGLLLYNRLNENYKQVQGYALDESKRTGELFNPDDFVYKGLHYSICHKDYYKKAAGVIVDHNIWLADKKTKKKYKKARLSELVREPLAIKGPLAIKDPEFLFLLALVDIIEPIKFFYQHSPACILDSIKIDVDSTKRSLTLAVINPCIMTNDWFKKIEGLKTWFAIDEINRGEDGNSITIYI